MRSAPVMALVAICAGTGIARADLAAGTSADGPKTAAPVWIEAVAGDHLFWQSQQDDHAVRHLLPGAGKPVRLGKECGSGYRHGRSAADGSVYCMDGESTIWRWDAVGNRTSQLRTGVEDLWGIAASGGRVYFTWSRDQRGGIGVVDVASGRARVLVRSVAEPLMLAADGDVVVWLDRDGALWSKNAGGAAPSRLDTITECAAGAEVAAECEIAIDHDALYLAYQPSCGSHEACPPNSASVRRRPRSGGAWTTLAGHLNMATQLRLDGPYVYWGDCIGGFIARTAKSGGVLRKVDAAGACSAYAVGVHDLYWFDDCEGLAWQNCRLRRAPK
jgi:hypothetical protein